MQAYFVALRVRTRDSFRSFDTIGRKFLLSFFSHYLWKKSGRRFLPSVFHFESQALFRPCLSERTHADNARGYPGVLGRSIVRTGRSSISLPMRQYFNRTMNRRFPPRIVSSSVYYSSPINSWRVVRIPDSKLLQQFCKVIRSLRARR